MKEALLVTELSDSLMACDIMEPVSLTCNPNTSIPDIFKLFSEQGIEMIPIVDEKGLSYGIAEKSTLEHFIHTKIVELHQKVSALG